MSCPYPAPKGLVSPQVCRTWGDTLSMGPRGCPWGFPVPMGMVGLVVSGGAGGVWYPQLWSCRGGRSRERASPAGEEDVIVRYRLRLSGIPPSVHPGAPSP